MNNLYKVLTTQEWELANSKGFIITELDNKDGFVHLSSSKQLASTLSLYFSKFEEVILIQLSYEQIKSNLKLESVGPSSKRSGSFYHLYGDLNIKHACKVWNLNRDAFALPEEVLLQAELPEKLIGKSIGV
jgi:uncharacterized protein (DUF952 family)